jgi:peptide/nickel transport system substrate-binding protein
MIRARARVLGMAVAGVLLVAACGGDDSGDDTTTTAAEATTTTATGETTTPGSDAPTTSAGESPSTTAATETTAPAEIPTSIAECDASVAPAPAGAESPAPEPVATTRTKLTIGSTLAPSNLDITTGSGAAIPLALLYNVYETLVKLNGDGEFQPLLASSYTVSDDGLTYTFHLRDGITFHNGDPLTAEDVKFSFNNSQANVAAGKAPAIIAQTLAPITCLSTPDDATVVIQLEKRSRNFLFDITQAGGVVVNEAAIADVATTPVGSGPFQFVSYDIGNRLDLAAFPGYWGNKPGLQEVEFRYITDHRALADSIRSPDGVDLIDNLDPELFAGFEGDTDFRTVNNVTNGETILAFNNARAPLDDVRVRQAITYAIDKQAVNDIAEGGYADIIGSFASPNDPWYVDLSGSYPYDPDKAQELLEEAGASDLQLTIEVPPTPYARNSAQVIQSQLADVGIDVTLNDIEFPLWIDQVFTKGDFDMTIISHVEARDIVLYGNPDYYWHYDNPEVQQLLADADAAATEEESNALYAQVQQIISDEAVNGFLFLLPGLTVAKADIASVPRTGGSLSYDLTNIG